MFSQHRRKRVDVIDIVNKLIDVVIDVRSMRFDMSLDVHRVNIDRHIESFPKTIDYIDRFRGGGISVKDAA